MVRMRFLLIALFLLFAPKAFAAECPAYLSDGKYLSRGIEGSFGPPIDVLCPPLQVPSGWDVMVRVVSYEPHFLCFQPYASTCKVRVDAYIARDCYPRRVRWWELWRWGAERESCSDKYPAHELEISRFTAPTGLKE